MNIGESGKLSPNMEDYLEAISLLKKDNRVARVRDIGRHMRVKTSSVTSALNTLSRKGMVIHERYGYVELTSRGEKLAQGVQRRHEVLIKFLTDILRIDRRIAAADACKMEHAMHPATFEKLAKFIGFVETHPCKDTPIWLERFYYYYRTGKHLSPRLKRNRQNSPGKK